jgi:2-keto-4-pentenoate hydratase/2-oxohepta-3-ene-1,7-dioic acid hydratase in catechol pathway
MKLVRYAAGGEDGIGILTDDGVLPTAHTGMLALIASGERPQPLPAARPLTEYRLLAPVPRPGKIFGSGINYASHKDENPGAVMPDEPGFFSKFPSSVVGPGDAIRLPAEDSQVDYEVELAVVIGRAGRDIPADSALDHVFGYTVVNDVSGRDIQFRPHQMPLGKGCDTFCPMGPVLLTADAVPDPAALRVSSRVNGEPRQDAPTSQMLFTVPALIAHASRHITLEPGDVIATGTPAGCGTFREPPLWLRPGDVVEVEVDAIGVLRNPVVAGW